MWVELLIIGNGYWLKTKAIRKRNEEQGKRQTRNGKKESTAEKERERKN